MRYPERLSVCIQVDRAAAETLQDQIVRQIVHAIDRNVLVPGGRVPSTRTVASVLRVSRSVAVAAYDRLFALGYLRARPGSGTYVARPATGPVAAVAAADPARRVDLVPGRPAMEGFPVAQWRSAWRAACHRPPHADGAQPAAGSLALREAVADHLRRVRGIACTAAQIVITSGARHALDLAVRAALKPGMRVAVENPARPGTRRILAERGVETVPLAVDADGARIEDLPADVDACVVTPVHHFPTGAALSPVRRAALAGWAAAGHGLLLHSDEGWEFPADPAPVPDLLSAAGIDHAVHLGCFCWMLGSGLRLGYLIAGEEVVGRIGELLQLTGEQPAPPAQHALAQLLSSGTVARHQRRTARAYEVRRELLREALDGLAPTARLRGLHAGAHAVLELHPAVPAAEVAGRLAARGVTVRTLADFHAGPGAGNGLVLGYGHLDEQTLRGAARLVAAAVRTA
ncbi:PLP-dependent aminotransferase family protein [Catellatospora sp. NPDC049609]|uniref:aminotransferase-like domain-containing protein n=1 Tax=Catellatospora sp. NPDC049609 TaxID=3155505 RepID=UPI003438F3DA